MKTGFARRLLAALLSATLVLTLLPASVLADEEYADTQVTEASPASDEDVSETESVSETEETDVQAEKAVPEGEADAQTEVLPAAEETTDAQTELPPVTEETDTQAEETPEMTGEEAPVGEAAEVETEESFEAGRLSRKESSYEVVLEYRADARIPAGAKLLVEEIKKEDDKQKVKEKKEDTVLYSELMEDAAAKISRKEAIEADSLPYARFFDITIIDKDGKPVEPASPVRVRIDLKDKATKTEDVNFAALHFGDEEEAKQAVSDESKLELIDVLNVEAKKVGTPQAESAVTFEADSFSVYGVVYYYTVDFYYNAGTDENPIKSEYHMNGGSSMMLSELFAKLGIPRGVSEVREVVFSDDSLLKVKPKAGDYELTSLAPFTSSERLTIRFADGTEIVLDVEDDQPTDSDPYFDIYWVEGVSGEVIERDPVSGKAVEVRQTPSEDKPAQSADKPYVSAQVEFQIGRSSKPIKQEEIKIVLPKSLFTQWDWDGDDVAEDEVRTIIAGVGQKPTQTNKDFWYYYGSKDENGKYVEDGNGEYLIITNYATYNGYEDTPKTFTCTISYPYIPSRVNGDMEHELKAEYVVEAAGYSVQQNNDTLVAKIETGAQVDSAAKSFKTENVSSSNIWVKTTTWNDTWGDFADTGLDASKDYVYVAMGYEVTVTGKTGVSDKPTRPFTIQITDETPGAVVNGQDGRGEGKVVAVTEWKPGVSALSGLTAASISGSSSQFRTFQALKDSGEYVIGDNGYPIGYVYGVEGGRALVSKTAEIPNNLAKDSNFSGGAATAHTLLLVAYPKEYYDEIKEPTGQYPDNASITNTAEVTVSEYGDGDDSKKTASAWGADQNVVFRYRIGWGGVTKLEYNGSQTNFPSNPTGVAKSYFNYEYGKQSNVNARLFQGEDENHKNNDNSSDMTREQATLQGYRYALENGQSVELLPYYLGDPDNTAFFWSLTTANPFFDPNEEIEVEMSDLVNFGLNPYTIELMDDQIYLDGNLLEYGDYEIVRAVCAGVGEMVFDPYTYGLQPISGYNRNHQNDPDFVPLEETKPDIYVRYAHGGNWSLAVPQAEEGTVYDLPAGAYQIKYVFETTRPTIRPDCYLVVKLHPTEHVKQIISEAGPGDDIQVVNVASFGLRDKDGKQVNLWDRDTILGTDWLGDRVAEHDSTGKYGDLVNGQPTQLPADTYLSHERTYQYLSGFDPKTTFGKTSGRSSDDTRNLISYRSYTLKSDQELVLYTDDKQATLESLDRVGIQHGQKEIVFFDLIPAGGTLNANSLRAKYRDSSSATVEGKISSYETIPNYNGTEQTLLKVTVKFPAGQDQDWGRRYDSDKRTLNLSTTVTLDLEVVFPWDDLAMAAKANPDNVREVKNYASVYVPGSNDGYPDDPKKTNPKNPNTGFRDDTPDTIFQDLLSDGDNDEDSFYYDSAASTFNIATASITGYSKYVKAESETTYRLHSAVQADESYSYRLRYSIEQSTMAKNIIIYDVLEYAWIDEAYLDGEYKEKYDLTSRYWMGTFDRVDVSQPVKKGADVKVYYSTFDREKMQTGLDAYTGAGDGVAPHADLTDVRYWTATTPAELEAMSKEEKAGITALAFDCSKKEDGSDFILTYDEEDNSLLQVLVYMTAPDEDEVANGWDGEGSYVDPEYVYAYNNSFLAAQSKNIDAPDESYTSNGARMSDGTTVRIAEPNPPIYKQVDDADQTAGGTSEEDMTEEDTVQLKDRDEVFKYTVTTKVPTLGVNADGRDERGNFSIYDKLVDELEFARESDVRVTIGKNSGKEAFFGYDPEGGYDGHKGIYRFATGAVDEQTGERVFDAEYFDSLAELPTGFMFMMTDGDGYYNNKYGESPNRLMFSLGSRPETETDPGFDRVREFSGSKVSIEFYAKIKAGVSLGMYEDEKVPNTAYYTVANQPQTESNTVFVEVDEETPNPEKKVGLVDDEGNETELGDHQDMAGPDQEIVYEINATIPYEHKRLTLADKLEPVLEIIPDTVEVNFNGEVEVTELNCIKEPVFDRYGRPVYDYSAIERGEMTYDDIERDENGNITNLPQAIRTTYEKILDEKGNEKKIKRSIDRTLTADDIEYYTGKKLLSLEQSAQSIRLNLDSAFINENGDHVIEHEVTKVITTDTEGNERIRYDLSESDYGEPYRMGGRQDYSVAGLNVKIRFKARIKDGANLEPYKTDGTTLIPNTVNYRFGDYPEKETEPVTVTPPDVSKTVNGTTHVDLANWDEIFTYKISTRVPRAPEGEELTSAVFSDTLEPVLEFVNNDKTTFTIAGDEQEISKIKREGQKLSVDLTEYAADYPGSLVVISFQARIKPGTTMDELDPYVGKQSQAEVPNEAKVNAIFSNGTETEMKSKPVTVTPPPIEKKVNEKDHEDLKIRDEVFTYSIRTWVPVADMQDEKATSFRILDTLEDVLEFTEEEATTITIDGKALSASEVEAQTTREGQKLTVELTEEQIAANPKKPVIVTFRSKIKDGADISVYKQNLVPNKASYQINNDAEVESNTVTVTPPPIEKLVNNKEHEDLIDRGEIFTYSIKVRTPIDKDLEKFEVSDTLVDVLEFCDDEPVTLSIGETAGDASIVKQSGQTLTADLLDLALANPDTDITITFRAKIKDSATDAELVAYAVDGPDAKVPNEASLKIRIGNEPEKELNSKPVTVTPPEPTPPPIRKQVNGKEHEVLGTATEWFEYRITTYVPTVNEAGEQPISFRITDTLENVLEFADTDEVLVSIGDAALSEEESAKQIVIEGQTITVNLTEEQIAANPKAEVIVSFMACIKDGADLSAYRVGEIAKVPNKAAYQIDNDAEFESNTVTVTPPALVKKVEGADVLEITDWTQTFHYTVAAVIAPDAVKVTLSDTMVDVLEFADEPPTITIGGKAVEADISIEGQTLKAVIGEAALAGKGGEEVVLRFAAKLKEGMDYSDYVVQSSLAVPNVAEMEINDDPARHYETAPVYVTPKEPPISKLVNGKMHEDLKSQTEVFTYTIYTNVPPMADGFAIEDILVDELTFADTEQANVTVDGQKVDAKITITGQRIRADLPESALGVAGKPVVLTFRARIKDGADISKYNDASGNPRVPNEASYEWKKRLGEDDGTGEKTEIIRKKSNVVTVTPPKPSTPSKPGKPGKVKTGDGNNVNRMTLFTLSLAALLLLLVFEKRRRRA